MDAAEEAERLLLQRAKQRSPSAWDEIYEASYVKLFRYCFARTGDQATAADLASHVFLEALEGIDRYEYRGRPLLAWLYRIARNVVSDHLRSRERESRTLEKVAASLEPSDPGPASTIGDRQDLGAALRQLTDQQQQVIALRYYADMTTREIAQAMDRSERAIYSLELRALVALRRLIDDSGLADLTRDVR